jgi:recombination associated protein RdgC
MASSPFKSFIPYLIKTGLVSDLGDYKSADPSGASWTTHGFVAPMPGEDNYIVHLETGGKLLCVQINDRILPGKVRDEELKKRVAKLEAAEARKVSKKEYAQLRDEVEFELLPKAFIRRTKVYVAILKGQRVGENLMLVFTSSQKKADEVVSLINVATGMPNPPWKIQTDWSLVGRLTTLARDCSLDPDDGYAIFEATDSAVLKGEDKQTIRIKDKELSDTDIGLLLKKGYEVHEIGVGMIDDRGEGHAITFVLNTNLTFKRLTFPSVKQHDDLYAEAVFVMPNLRDLLSAFFQLPADGGFGLLPDMPVNAADDEDEL